MKEKTYTKKPHMDFVNVPPPNREWYGGRCCPCWAFGNEKALTKTQDALEEYYK